MHKKKKKHNRKHKNKNKRNNRDGNDGAYRHHNVDPVSRAHQKRFYDTMAGANYQLRDPVRAFAASVNVAQQTGVVDLQKLAAPVDLAQLLAVSALEQQDVNVQVTLCRVDGGSEKSDMLTAQACVRATHRDQNTVELAMYFAQQQEQQRFSTSSTRAVFLCAPADNFVITMAFTCASLKSEVSACIGIGNARRTRDISQDTAQLLRERTVTLRSPLYDNDDDAYAHAHAHYQLPAAELLVSCANDDRGLGAISAVRIFVNYAPAQKRAYQLNGVATSIGTQIGEGGHVHAVQIGSGIAMLSKEECAQHQKRFYELMLSGKPQDRDTSATQSTKDLFAATMNSDANSASSTALLSAERYYGDRLRIAVGLGSSSLITSSPDERLSLPASSSPTPGSSTSILRNAALARDSTTRRESSVRQERPVFWGSLSWTLTVGAVLSLIEKNNLQSSLDDHRFVVDVLLADHPALASSVRALYDEFYAMRNDGNNATPLTAAPAQRGPTLTQLLTNTSGLPATYSMHADYLRHLVIEVLSSEHRETVSPTDAADEEKASTTEGGSSAFMGSPERRADALISAEQLRNERLFALELHKNGRLQCAPGAFVHQGDNYVEAAILSAVAVRLLVWKKLQAARDAADEGSEIPIAHNNQVDAEHALEDGAARVFGISPDALEWNPLLDGHGRALHHSDETSLFSAADGAVSDFASFTALPASFLDRNKKELQRMLATRFRVDSDERRTGERFVCAGGWHGELIGSGRYTLLQRVGAVRGVGFSMALVVPELNLWTALTLEESDVERATRLLLSRPSAILHQMAFEHVHPATPRPLRFESAYPPNHSQLEHLTDETHRCKQPPNIQKALFGNCDQLLRGALADPYTGKPVLARLQIAGARDTNNPVFKLTTEPHGEHLATMCYDPKRNAVREVLSGPSGILGAEIPIFHERAPNTGDVTDTGTADTHATALLVGGNIFSTDKTSTAIEHPEVARNVKQLLGASDDGDAATKISHGSSGTIALLATDLSSSSNDVYARRVLIATPEQNLDMDQFFWNTTPLDHSAPTGYKLDDSRTSVPLMSFSNGDEHTAEFVGARHRNGRTRRQRQRHNTVGRRRSHRAFAPYYVPHRPSLLLRGLRPSYVLPPVTMIPRVPRVITRPGGPLLYTTVSNSKGSVLARDGKIYPVIDYDLYGRPIIGYNAVGYPILP